MKQPPRISSASVRLPKNDSGNGVPLMPYVFISHASQDQRTVKREILSLLQANGIETWYSTNDIKSSEEWQSKIVTALDNCSWFLVALSPHSVSSRWVRAEVDRAFSKGADRIVPVLLKACDYGKLHLQLPGIQHIDLTRNVPLGQAKLIERLTGEAPTPLPQETSLPIYIHAALLLLGITLLGLFVWYFSLSSESQTVREAINSSANTGSNANGGTGGATNQSNINETMPSGRLTPRKERIQVSDAQPPNSNNTNSGNRD